MLTFKTKNKQLLAVDIPDQPRYHNFSAIEVLDQCAKLVSMSEKRTSYEDTRTAARKAIVEYLTSGENAFTGEQVLYHAFDWSDTLNLQTSTWTGINILIWTNTTPVKKGNKFSVVAARYDSQHWWSPELHSSFMCSTSSSNPEMACRRNVVYIEPEQRSKTLQLSYDLLGASMVVHLAKTSLLYQKQLKLALESTSALELLKFWNKSDAKSIQTGIFEERPILFVLFDRESVGSLGSKLWYEYYNIEKHLREGNVRSLTGIDLNNWKPSPKAIPDANTYTGPTWKSIVPSLSPSLDWFHDLLAGGDE